MLKLHACVKSCCVSKPPCSVSVTLTGNVLLSFNLSFTVFFKYISAVKNLQNTTNSATLQYDSAGSMEMHCNPATVTYENTIIYKYKKYRQKNDYKYDSYQKSCHTDHSTKRTPRCTLSKTLIEYNESS